MATATKERKPRTPRAKQQKLIEDALPEEKTLIDLADKWLDCASERGRLGQEMQEFGEAILAEMKHLKKKTFSRDGLTIVRTETKEKVKVTREEAKPAEGEGDETTETEENAT